MLRLNLPRNTAYNPMIYITFFIVILIDKRGVREAERGGRLENKYEHKYEYRYEYRHTPPQQKEVSTQRHHPAATGTNTGTNTEHHG